MQRFGRKDGWRCVGSVAERAERDKSSGETMGHATWEWANTGLCKVANG